LRHGQNPAKLIGEVAQPEKITVAIVTYIPFLEGYYAESLDILKLCLGSIWKNTELSYDLLVFDNASCPEVRAYLNSARDQGRIQYLVLSDQNLGKGGAWNFIFGAAPGEFVAYADSDVFFYPGWLPAQLTLFEEFPNLGMATGAPLRIPQEFSTSTIEWAEGDPDSCLESGVLLSWEDWWKHARSLGVESEDEGRRLYAANQDSCLVHAGKRYFTGAAHFQFLARREVLQRVLPLPSQRPMGQVRSLDIAINQLGYLRLSTPEWWVEHLGNTLQGSDFEAKSDQSRLERRPARRIGSLRTWKPFRRALLWLHDRTFDLLYRN
jgi:glycosyltransferase involved in cell wall biosynthesis